MASERVDNEHSAFMHSTAHARAELALELGGMGSFVWSLSDNMAIGDACVGALFGVDNPEARKSAEVFLANVHPDDLPDLRQSAADAIESGSDYDAEFRIVDGERKTVRWIAGKGRVIDRDGERPLLIGVNWDITRTKTHEADLKMMVREMNHRVKNSYAVTQALVTLGGRSAADLPSFVETLKTQIRAMADSHMMAARFMKNIDARRTADFVVGDVVRLSLAAWQGDDVVQIGDDGATLPVKHISNLAMLLYELATNATKYGALGSADGSLSVHVNETDDDILLRWSERSAGLSATGALEEEVGVAAGFGSLLMQHCTAALGARLIREMRPEGLLVELRIPKPYQAG